MKKADRLRPPRSKKKQYKQKDRKSSKSPTKAIANSRVDRQCTREGSGGLNGEKMRDATAKSDRAVKITISLLWRVPCTLKREGPVSVGGIHHRARVTRRYFSRDVRIDILCRSRGKSSTPSSSVAILALSNKNTLNQRTSRRMRMKEQKKKGWRESLEGKMNRERETAA